MERDTQVDVAWLPVSERFLFSLREAPPPMVRCFHPKGSCFRSNDYTELLSSTAAISSIFQPLTPLREAFISPRFRHLGFLALVKQEATKLAANVGAKMETETFSAEEFSPRRIDIRRIWAFSVPGSVTSTSSTFLPFQHDGMLRLTRLA